MNDTKVIILQKSLELFLQRSYKEVTLDHIVKAIGLTKGAFYHYYKNKEEIFEECVKYFYNHFMITDFSTFPKASLKAFYMAYLARLKDTPKGIEENSDSDTLLFIIEARRRVSSYMEIHFNQRKKEQVEWKSIIDYAKKIKEINTSIPSKRIATMFLNLSDGIALNRMVTLDKNMASEELKNDWDMLYNLLGGM
ncbi:MAG TPA: TetR/AcrR family transcriptional regulator [Ignavibacteriaceae bacterium]|nr:TetR/AcrR family transcriptional regulator [Ignavibacteriaceae bacterium]